MNALHKYAAKRLLVDRLLQKLAGRFNPNVKTTIPPHRVVQGRAMGAEFTGAGAKPLSAGGLPKPRSMVTQPNLTGTQVTLPPPGQTAGQNTKERLNNAAVAEAKRVAARNRRTYSGKTPVPPTTTPTTPITTPAIKSQVAGTK